MYDVDESVVFMVEFEDWMVVDIICECGLEDYCDGFIGFGQFVIELVKVWFDMLEYGMEDVFLVDVMVGFGDIIVRY